MRWTFKLGLVQCVNGPSAVLTDSIRTKLKLAVGDHVVIASDDHGTSIVRQLKSIRTQSRMKDDFVYVDNVSLHLLMGEVEELVEIEKSEVALDVP